MPIYFCSNQLNVLREDLAAAADITNPEVQPFRYGQIQGMIILDRDPLAARGQAATSVGIHHQGNEILPRRRALDVDTLQQGSHVLRVDAVHADRDDLRRQGAVAAHGRALKHAAVRYRLVVPARKREPGTGVRVLLQQLQKGLRFLDAGYGLEGQQIDTGVQQRLDARSVPVDQLSPGHALPVEAGVFGRVVQVSAVRTARSGDHGSRLDGDALLPDVVVHGSPRQAYGLVEQVQALAFAYTQILHHTGHGRLVGVGLDDVGTGAQEVHVRVVYGGGVSLEEPRRPQRIVVDLRAHVPRQLPGEAAVQDLRDVLPMFYQHDC